MHLKSRERPPSGKRGLVGCGAGDSALQEHGPTAKFGRGDGGGCFHLKQKVTRVPLCPVLRDYWAVIFLTDQCSVSGTWRRVPGWYLHQGTASLLLVMAPPSWLPSQAPEQTKGASEAPNSLIISILCTLCLQRAILWVGGGTPAAGFAGSLGNN